MPPRVASNLIVRSSQPRKQTPWLRALPIMRAMQSINGFLYDDEADLLLAATARVLAMAGPPRAVVEIGSYCGKSTVVMGMTARVLIRTRRCMRSIRTKGALGWG